MPDRCLNVPIRREKIRAGRFLRSRFISGGMLNQ
jgi:hypothetical protein